MEHVMQDRFEQRVTIGDGAHAESFSPLGPVPLRDFLASCRMRAEVSGGANSFTSPLGTGISLSENISRPIRVGSLGTSTAGAALGLTAAAVMAAMLVVTSAFMVSTASAVSTPAPTSRWA